MLGCGAARAPPCRRFLAYSVRPISIGHAIYSLDRLWLLPYPGPSPTLEATMGMRSDGLSALLVLLVVSGCGGGRRSVLVPPRLDLQPYGRLGLVTFTVENAKGSLHEFATERFAEDMLAAQPGTEVLELGTQDSLLRRVGEQDLGIAAAQELGKQREVGAVFAGHLKVTNPKGTGGLAGLVTPHLEATVRVDLTVRDRKSTRLNSSHDQISYAVFCLKKKKKKITT